MRIDHLEMPLVDRQIDRLAQRAAGMVDIGTEIGEFDEILEVLDRPVAAPLVEIVDEGRAVIGREHHRVAADDDVAFGISRMLHVTRRRGRAKLSRQAPRKPHALALDVAARRAEEVERAGEVAKFDADLLQERLRVALDDFEPLRAQHFGERDLAGDVGNGLMRPMRAGGAARVPSAARLPGGGQSGFGHGRPRALLSLFVRDIATTRRRFEPRKLRPRHAAGANAAAAPSRARRKRAHWMPEADPVRGSYPPLFRRS